MDKTQVDPREKEMREIQKESTLMAKKDYTLTLGVAPGGQYLGHLETDSGKAVDISDSILKLLRDNDIGGG